MKSIKNIKYLLLFLILLANISFSQDYWLHVPSPTTRVLTKCSFVDTVFGWAAGDSGTIINTTNGGLNWGTQNSGITDYNIDDIFFLNRRLGWAVSNDYFFNGTFMLKTTNGGINWTSSRFPDTTVIISLIYFTDSLNGFASGFSGKIFKTSNNGNSWVECIIDTTGCQYLYGFPKLRINFLNQSTGFMCGGHNDIIGAVWKTTNSGSNWSTYCITAEPLYDIKIINANKIITCGGDPEFGAITATSYNSAVSWNYRSIFLFGAGRDIAFRTTKEVWMPLGYAQSWAVSLDTGSVNSPWIGIPAPDSTAVYSALFKSPTFGFAFGTYGSILKYNTAVIGITPGGSIIPKDYSLGQNYPNPFNPSTVITYNLAKPEFVKISIYDLTGKLIKVFIEGNRPAGFNRFRFQNFGLASGVYIYKLDAGNFTESKKMVLVK